MTTDTCYFCGQIAGSKEHNLLHRLIGSSWSARPVLRENAGAVAMPSIGALTAGHALISPKRHLRSFAVAETDERSELERLAIDVQRQLEAASGLPVHAFEHGSSSTCGERVACSVEHAHRHVIPYAGNVIPALWELADWSEIVGVDAIADATQGLEYLTYHAPDGRVWAATTETGFPSQLLRRAFADAFGRGERWNWRVDANLEAVLATIALLDAPAHLAAA